MTRNIAVDVWSDVACPWCYIGKRKMELGIKQFAADHPDVHVDVVFHSYQLNPEMPVDYEGTQADYLGTLKGFSPEQIAQMNERLLAIAASVGLNYDLTNQQMTNTGLAHQLLHYAKTQGKQAAMKERIMSAHFVEALHVGRIDVLAQLAVEVGLDRDEVLRVLQDGTYLDAFAEDVAQARAYGIQGVPFFVIQNKYGIEGAQQPESFVHAFETVLADLVGAGAAAANLTANEGA